MQRIAVSEIHMKAGLRMRIPGFSPSNRITEHLDLDGAGWKAWLVPETASYQIEDKEGEAFLLSRDDVLWAKIKRHGKGPKAAPEQPPAAAGGEK